MATELDPCLDCGVQTLKVITHADGSTYGVGINRLWFGGDTIEGWKCQMCAGYECDKCGKQIALDEEVQIDNEQGWDVFHQDCAPQMVSA